MRLQIYDQFGHGIGSQALVNTKVVGSQVDAAVATLAGGSFVVSWQEANPKDVRAQVFNSSGEKVAGEILVNSTTAGTQDQHSVAALMGGDFLVVWRDSSRTGADASGTAIRAQRISATGDKVGNETLVNTTVAGNQSGPDIVALKNGGYAIFWDDVSGGRAQFFDASGSSVGTEISVNSAEVVVLKGGNVLVAWNDTARIFSQSGEPVGSQFSIPYAFESKTKLVALSDGNFLVLSGGGSVICQLFSSAGVGIGDELTVGSAKKPPGEFSYSFVEVADAIVLADGRVVVTWTKSAFSEVDHGFPGTHFDRNYTNYQAIVNSRQGAVFLTGTAIADDLIGTDKNDRLAGAAGDDVLHGGAGADTLNGNAGNDRLAGDAGKDTLDGGVGHDAADYSHTSGAVIVTLNGAANVQVTVGGQVEDTIRNFEGVFGGRATTASRAMPIVTICEAEPETTCWWAAQTAIR